MPLQVLRERVENLFVRLDTVSIARACVTIFLIALCVRVGLVLLRGEHRNIEFTEVVLVAASLADHGEFSNAYGGSSGPTAHTSPLYPLLLSGLFRIFETDLARATAQQVFSCVLASLQYALLVVLAGACGVSRSTGILAGVLGALVPVNFWAETKGSFETALSGLMAVAIVINTALRWRKAESRFRSAFGGGVLFGLALLTSPSLLPVLCGLVLGELLVGSMTKRRALHLTLLVTVPLVVLLPWTLRNKARLGAMIWTRSNLGLELHISNNDESSADYQENHRSRLIFRMHPHANVAEREKLNRMGEVAYHAEHLGAARRWIGDHPGQFLRLTVERTWLFWFPRMLRPSQTVILRSLSILGLVGLVWWLRRGSKMAWIFLVLYATYPLLYYFVHAFPRYRSPIDWSFWFLAAQLLVPLRTRLLRD